GHDPAINRLSPLGRYDPDRQADVSARLCDDMGIGDDLLRTYGKAGAMRQRDKPLAIDLDDDDTHDAPRGRVDIRRLRLSDRGCHQREQQQRQPAHQSSDPTRHLARFSPSSALSASGGTSRRYGKAITSPDDHYSSMCARSIYGHPWHHR